ncbi:ATP synthase F1 subunit gamma [Candidatus Gottesmanbacteria bacterium]|nr:ATP synthase F1 subunit gamma [Candidatus Gottesmanbacteria bacterium]
MANIRLIKGRIKSAKNIAQITKAMEMVAASKMKKAQAVASAGKLYAGKIYDMVQELARRVDVTDNPLLQKSKTLIGKSLVIYITTNKGLCGGLNSTSFRFLTGQYKNFQNTQFITLGKKGAGYVVSFGGTIIADFSQISPFTSAVPALTTRILEEFLERRVDGIDLVYNEFLSIVKQEPRRKMILPLSIESSTTQVKKDKREFLIEPSPKQVFDALLPHYLENQIRDAILQSEASEQSSRMMAMRNATDNALSLMDELTLVYNKARQEKITYEISDMVTARLAVEQ